jgi:predicted extracellular nuclease
VSGVVNEFRPAGDANNLTMTEIASPTIIVQSSGNALPAPIIVGTGGRIPPSTIIDDDSSGDVETTSTFDPQNDGIDFWESLEAMRVQINNARAVGPSRYYASSHSWEVPVVGDNGVHANVLTARGGVVVRANDFNPERILLADALVALPHDINVGDGFTAPIVGVMDYSYSNFKLYPTTAPMRINNGLTQETTLAQTGRQLAVATFNVENLDPNDSDGDADVADGKFAGLANLIVNHLKSPDLLSIEEIQDNDGSVNSTIVDASTTWTRLIDAIVAAGGPTYQYRQINPVDDQDGGQTGGNIRQGFLFRTDRGLAFVDRPGAGSTTANAVINNGGVPQLQYSPGRIDPTNVAFTDNRKPLAAEFTFNGYTLFVIANHWKSKGEDQPLFGRYQPPTLATEAQRNQQATVVGNFVASIRAIDPNALIIVLGDLNDFEFSTPLSTLKTLGGLVDEIEALPQNERYTYTYEGNSQTLDHILVSPALAARRVRVDVVHTSAEFAARWNDHDAVVAVYNFGYTLFFPFIAR